MSVILELKDDHRRVFTKRICYDLQLKLYNHRDISVEALREVYEGFLSHLLSYEYLTYLENHLERIRECNYIYGKRKKRQGTMEFQ